MRNNFTEIISLEDSDLLSSHRRSKSSSQFNSPTNKNKKRFLIEKKSMNFTNAFERSDLNSNKLNRGNEIHEIESTSNVNTSHAMNDSHTFNERHLNYPKYKKVESCDNGTEYDNSIDFSLNSNKKIKNKLMNDNTDKYIRLKEKYHESQNAEQHWRSSYFNLLNDSLSYEETIKSLIEENRIHQEYIISLENRLDKLLASCNNITHNFHNSLFKNLNSFNNPSNENISNLFIKNYNEVLHDYKKQLEILAEEKDSLSTNLSITRHQQLQCTLKLEDAQTRLYNIERARMEDLKVLENLSK